MNYILDLSSEIGTSNKTSQLACSYVDSFLGKKQLNSLSVLQLVGVTALSIASKFEEGREILPHQIYELCAGKFSLDAIVTLELFMLDALDWTLSLVTPCEIIQFLLLNTCDSSFDFSKLAMHAEAYASLCMTDSKLMSKGCSTVALASILCVLDKFKFFEFRKGWTQMVEKHYNVDFEAVESCLELVYKKLSDLGSEDEVSTCPSSPLM